MMESRLQSLIKGKNVIYITVKNLDYIRTSQIQRLLLDNTGKFTIYSSEKNNLLLRTIEIKRKIKYIDISGYEVIIAGFLPQLIWNDIKKLLKKAKMKPVIIAEMFLSLYDTIVCDRKAVLKNGFISNWCKHKDMEVVSEADLVVTDTKVDAKYFCKEFAGQSKDKKAIFEPLYLEADKGYVPGLIDTSDNTVVRLVHKNRVLYFGSGIPLQGTEYVVDAMKTLAQEYGFDCVYIGGTKGLTYKQKSFLYSNSITYYKHLSQKDLYSQIYLSDICLAGHFNPDSDKADRTIPGKAYIYELCDKKMILGDTKANHEIFKSDSKHVFVKRGSSKAIVEAVIKMKSR